MPTIVENGSRAPSSADTNARILLLACLHSSTRPQDVVAANMDEADWQRFGALAAEQRVRPLVREALTRNGNLGVPTSVSCALDQQCRRIAARLLHRHAVLAGIIEALAEADIPVILLKGACLATLVYRDIALREMNDLDLLVPRERLQAAVEVMQARGYKPRRQFSVAVDVTVMHHMSALVKGDIAVELHWNVTQPGQSYTIDPAELWPRAVPMLAGGGPALRLGLEDLLLHLCVHTSYQHQFEFGLRPSCDIAAVIRRYQDRIDWDVVCQRSARWRWSKGAYVALALARQLVGAEVPRDILSRLQGSNRADAVGAAEHLVWTTPDEHRAFNPMLAALGAHAGWPHKIRRGLARLAPSRSELAWMYSIQPGSSWLPLYYIRRALYLLRQHGPSAMRLVAGTNPDLLALAERRDVMRQWLLDS